MTRDAGFLPGSTAPETGLAAQPALHVPWNARRCIRRKHPGRAEMRPRTNSTTCSGSGRPRSAPRQMPVEAFTPAACPVRETALR